MFHIGPAPPKLCLVTYTAMNFVFFSPKIRVSWPFLLVPFVLSFVIFYSVEQKPFVMRNLNLYVMIRYFYADSQFFVTTKTVQFYYIEIKKTYVNTSIFV